ncbi:MAG: hypothetical protein H5U37_04535 [Caldisericia bacterium]|nr:hypothetical protein [Caldisericia bacterium]
MKNLIILSLILGLFFSFSLINVKGENEKIVIKLQKGNKTIYINDQPLHMDVAPIEVPPGRIMVPVRFVSEGLGANVFWDDKTEIVTITIDSIPYLKFKILNLQNEITNKEDEINKLNNLLIEKENKITELEKENDELKNKLRKNRKYIFSEESN